MTLQSLPVVQTAGLCKTFKDFWRRPRVHAVADLDLQIHAGEVVGLLGPNGSGKTTTIKMLLGLLYPTKGRISLFGKAPTDVSVKARIGFLPEESYLYRFLVAHETLDYFGRLFRLPKRVREDRSQRLLDMVGLRHEAKRPVGEYSKGMARRIGLAQALINDPEFLILDEPTSGLDPIGAKQIKDVIRSLGSKGKTILLSSHVLADVEDVCDRVIILYGGRQMAEGDINELLSEHDRTQITLPSLSDAMIQKITDIVAKEADVDGPIDVSRPRQKLETFFLQIVEDAQARNVETSGARGAGAMPDFLQKPTDSTTQEVVESLIDASARRHDALPEGLVSPTPIAKAPEPAHEVIDSLVDGDAKPDDPSTLTTPPQSDADADAPKADAHVIDSLIQGGGKPAPEDPEESS